jgi:hypothetical protein
MKLHFLCCELDSFFHFHLGQPPRKKHEDDYHGFLHGRFSKSREVSVIALQTHEDVSEGPLSHERLFGTIEPRASHHKLISALKSTSTAII